MKAKLILILLFLFTSSYFYSQSDNSAILKEIKIKCEKIKTLSETCSQISKTIEKEDKTYEKYTAFYNGDILVMMQKEVYFTDYRTKFSYLYDNGELLYIRKTNIKETTLVNKEISEFFYNNNVLISAFVENEKVADNELETIDKDIVVSNADFINLMKR